MLIGKEHNGFSCTIPTIIINLSFLAVNPEIKKEIYSKYSIKKVLALKK